MSLHEVNFDGLIGPTHNYAGLSFGNLASENHSGSPSNPRQAARQGLAKMKLLRDLGLCQGVIPPHERPHMGVLRRLGFSGSDDKVLKQVAAQEPWLLRAVSSASAMWTANAATVSPFMDTLDGLTHITPANLVGMFHRSIESAFTSRLLHRLFSDLTQFRHHPALPANPRFADEGAANHMRLCGSRADPGVELFIYGTELAGSGPERYPARQTGAACRALIRLHQLDDRRQVIARQSPRVIDLGVFHNDVIAVANLNLLFIHQHAFVDGAAVISQLREKLAPVELNLIEVPESQVTVEQAVGSYLFNSQLVSQFGGADQLLIAPVECCENRSVKRYLDWLLENSPHLREVHYVDLRQSMYNGGGPACLRLRILLSDRQIASFAPCRVMLDDRLYRELGEWVEHHYRDRLSEEDLADPGLLQESRTALDDLTGILGLGTIYDFQR